VRPADGKEAIMILTSPDEAYRYIGAALLEAFSAPGVETRLAGHQLRVALIDPDCVLHIDAVRGELRFERAGDDHDEVLIAMRGDSAVRFCQGRLDVTSAVASGEIVMVGDWGRLHDLLTG
jgi:hypothetical protein